MQNTIIKNIKFPEGLPVSQRVEDIKKAITNNLNYHYLWRNRFWKDYAAAKNLFSPWSWS